MEARIVLCVIFCFLAHIEIGISASSRDVTGCSCGPAPPWRPLLVNFTVWREGGGHPAEFVASTELTVPFNSSFYQAMQIAQLSSDTFRFESTILPDTGHFVTSINGLAHQPDKEVFWHLYRLSSPPDPQGPPTFDLQTPKGVDETLVDVDGENFLFWLRATQFD